MQWARWITVAWPGLTQLWISGAWLGLALGVAFACVLDLAIVTTFVWTDLMGLWSRVGIWFVLVMVWGSAAAISVRQLRSSDPRATDNSAEDLFRRAGREYLSGNWIAAEQLLTQLVRSNPKDIDAQLMLASLLRRTGQLTEASQRLRKLETTDGAEKWKAEIKRERQLLKEQLQPPTSDKQNEIEPERTKEEESAANRAA